MPKKVFIRTFGCQMNAYDSSKMADILHASEGMETTDTPENADVILLNTCSVREKAQEKVFSDLGRIRELKQRNPELVIGVGGCVASQEGAAILTRAPYVDVVFGPQTLHRLPALIAQRKRSGVAQVDISFPEVEKFDHLPPARADGVNAFVSIMEGCSKYCSFCVVPYTRGEEVSRKLDDVLTEVAELAAQGVKDVTLLGQNVNAYRTTLSDGAPADFALLLEYVAEIPGIERLRYTTSHPKEFSPRLIDSYTRIPQLTDHIHLPVQSGADRVLAAMKRGYTVLEFKSIIRRLRAIRPQLSITSDFIVGFPGETDEDFEKTLQLVKEINFDSSYSFLYSKRPGTPAADLADTTPHEVKLARLHRLQAQLDAQEKAINQSMVGSQQSVLIEGLSKREGSDVRGRTSNNRVVNVVGAPDLIGQCVNVRITEVMAHTLRGEIVAASVSPA